MGVLTQNLGRNTTQLGRSAAIQQANGFLGIYSFRPDYIFNICLPVVQRKTSKSNRGKEVDWD
jgi:hypothetical protein